jgi:hypothetical protein
MELIASEFLVFLGMNFGGYFYFENPNELAWLGICE